ncbi:inorganic pyrophosphatase [Scheffersomyces amazonensis]|uniref:inorganic pyrophosphatase n=1 Tax=Scheffersomyces amazonensis TaxID=1078765 RepID=UPI00315D00B5
MFFSSRSVKFISAPLSMSCTRASARLNLTYQHLSASSYTTTTTNTIDSIGNINQGTKYTSDFKNYAINKSTGKVLSYFHDIPLDLNIETREANMIVEVPRWSNAKFEISTKLDGNPIVQDIKNGQVRFVKNLFPHHGYIHNYGAFPQTWEDPTTENEKLGLFGDNDPLDVCEIGSAILPTGTIKRVKILGSLALIDDGELDWKVIVVDTQDPLAKEVYDIHHLFTKCPGLLETTRHWFRDYKLADGKPQNEFAFNGEYKNSKQTLEIIQECNQSWKRLIAGKVKVSDNKNIPTIANVTLSTTPQYRGTFDDSLLNNPSRPDAVIPPLVHKNYFISTD